MGRKRLAGLGASLTVLLLATVAAAGPGEHLNWGGQLHGGASACPAGVLVINVVQKAINDDDSGVAGNAWAKDEYVRQIQVVQTAPGSFCATVSYRGSFSTNAGASPGNTGSLEEGVVGTFQGGYSAIVTGTLRSSPAWRTRGSVGTFDYACDGAFNCPGYASWVEIYFDGSPGFAYAWWGWVYHAGNNGSWVNSSDGNSGDITGN
jgi:hypothetical protein